MSCCYVGQLPPLDPSRQDPDEDLFDPARAHEGLEAILTIGLDRLRSFIEPPGIGRVAIGELPLFGQPEKQDPPRRSVVPAAGAEARYGYMFKSLIYIAYS